MNARQFVSQFQTLVKRGRRLKAAKISTRARPKVSAGAPTALIFSPHPDDECIVSGLALRLLREAKWNVVNVAVTLGSRKERRPARRRELRNACAALGFGLMVAGERGLEHITLESRRRDWAHWNTAVRIVARILAEQRPRVIFLPHEHDWHATHVGTHFLVLDALKILPAGYRGYVVETEFWGQMTNPNLLVELGVAEAGDLVAALACHAGEVRRNPYHAWLPAWLMDNVRRGAELLGGQGRGAPDVAFGTIYRLRRWSRGQLTQVQHRQWLLPRIAHAGSLFR